MVLVCPAGTAETRDTQQMECAFGLFSLMENGMLGLQPLRSWDSCFTFHLRMHCVHFWRRFVFAPSCVLEKKKCSFFAASLPDLSHKTD